MNVVLRRIVLFAFVWRKMKKELAIGAMTVGVAPTMSEKIRVATLAEGGA